MESSAMIISFIVAPREPAYIHQTIASMYLSDPSASRAQIRLYLDADNDSFLKAYEHNQNPKVLIAPKEQRGIEHHLLRLTLAQSRALSEAGNEEHFVVAEDDLLFLDGWTSRLQAAVAAARRTSGEAFILSGYSPMMMVGDTIAKWSDSRRFYGNQFLYVPKSVRERLSRCLKDRLGELPSDLLIGRWAAETNVPIFATIPSIVQHVGKKSSIGSPWHSSPMWPNSHWR
jgi:hypothetical protein